MIKIIALILVVSLMGCANQEPRTAEQKVADSILAQTLLDGALTPGKDKRCVHILSFELCYSRERSVYAPLKP